jgi:hypothetical protein
MMPCMRLLQIQLLHSKVAIVAAPPPPAVLRTAPTSTALYINHLKVDFVYLEGCITLLPVFYSHLCQQQHPAHPAAYHPVV